jgi:hypothetical protein
MNQRKFNFQQAMQATNQALYGQVTDVKMQLPPELER